MDLGTDYCYTRVLLALLRSLTRGASWVLVVASIIIIVAWSITPAGYDEGAFATIHNAATRERGYNTTSPP